MTPELQEIVDEAARLLDGATTLEDRDYNLIAFAAQHGAVDQVRQASIMQKCMPPESLEWFEQFGVRDATEPLRTPADPSRDMLGRLCFPVRWCGVGYGYLWAIDDRTPLDSALVDQVSELAQHAGLQLSQLASQRHHDALTVSELLSADEDVSRRSAIRLADRGPISYNTPIAVVVVGCWNPEPSSPININLGAVLPRDVLADSGPNSTTIIVPLQRDCGLGPVRQLAAIAIETYEARRPAGLCGPAVAGIGAARPGLFQTRASWMEARIAARVAASRSNASPIAEWDALGVYRLIAAAPDPYLAELVIDPAVRRLLDSGDADLIETVRQYLDCAGHPQLTANVLSIHRQTLYYRLNKAEQLTGLDLKNGLHRTQLHLALTLLPLLPLPAS